MTRINLVPVDTLHSKHLLAEYRELPRVFGLVLSAQRKGYAPNALAIPAHYCLGKGHVTFFYDKLQWLSNRFNALVHECIARGFNIQHTLPPADAAKIQGHWWNDWTPRPEDIALSAARIAERMPK